MSLKNNKYWYALTIILFIILILFIFFLVNQNENTMLKLELSSANSNSSSLLINTNSLIQIETILNKYNKSIDNNKLLTILETQRTFFIGIITILSFLVALIGIFNLIKNINDKNQERVFNEFMKESKDELIILKLQSAKLYLLDQISHLQQITTIFFLDDSTEVNNLNLFNLSIIETMNKSLKYMQNDNINDLSCNILNFTYFSILYASRRNYFTSLSYKVCDNLVLSTIFNYIYTIYDKVNYEHIKTYFVREMKRLNNIDVVF